MLSKPNRKILAVSASLVGCAIATKVAGLGEGDYGLRQIRHSQNQFCDLWIPTGPSFKNLKALMRFRLMSAKGSWCFQSGQWSFCLWEWPVDEETLECLSS